MEGPGIQTDLVKLLTATSRTMTCAALLKYTHINSLTYASTLSHMHTHTHTNTHIHIHTHTHKQTHPHCTNTPTHSQTHTVLCTLGFIPRITRFSESVWKGTVIQWQHLLVDYGRKRKVTAISTPNRKSAPPVLHWKDCAECSLVI